MEATSDKAKDGGLGYLLGLVGAAVGGGIGYLLFWALIRQGFYAMIMPGAFVGIGCGLLSGRRSVALGVVCAVAALILSLFLEWHFFPFVKDESLAYFLTHLHKLTIVTKVMIPFGLLFAFWFGMGRKRD